MDLTGEGGSGSFYILWSGLYKLTTAAAIPYYTGRYAPSEDNGYSRRGFGFVTIGSELDFFTSPVRDIEQKLLESIEATLMATLTELVLVTVILIVLVVLVAFWMSLFLTRSLTRLVQGISRFRAGEWHFRFNAPVKDEFGALADAFDEMADSLAASFKHPLCVLNLEQKIVYLNEEALALTSKPLDTVVGSLYGDISIYPPGSSYCPLTALKTGREADIIFKEDENRYFKGKANYLFDREGRQSGYIVESLDVTEVVAQQLEMEKAMNEAQRANQHKGEFLARMSHEIRTPMNAIMGLTSLVRKSLDEQPDSGGDEMSEVKDNLEQIDISSQHLLGLLNDILDISKIEAGKIELHNEEAVELSGLAETVAGIIKPRCIDKKQDFETVFDSFTDCSFSLDALRLRQVLINLLGNAVKFTPERGKVTFKITRKDRRPGETLVEFAVCDSGIGIPLARRDVIFKPFEQAGSDITSKFGGSGLGLAISHHIVQLMGGKITVKSEEDHGSEFSFSLWLREAAKQKKKIMETVDVSAGQFKGRRVLVVDDVDLNRKIVKAMLRDTGLEIDEADDGSAAVEKFKEMPENTYSLVFMDVLMPKVGGYEATQAIRALPRSDAGTVPVVALTAHAFTEDIERAMAAGMNAHLAKPVKRESLLEMVFRFLKPSP
jgi:signal transduction histidine kinase/HAMP domain-containing protein/ActR/RegA family two-component response regulator